MILKPTDAIETTFRSQGGSEGICYKVPLIHMTEGNILCRCPQSLCRKRFSVISLGICNFHCPYCQLGGGLPRIGQRIPLAVDVDIAVIQSFIEQQIQRGNPIKVSGGEPTVNMPLAVCLLDHIRSCGGYSCADTSGWAPDRTAVLADHADQIAIDLKGPPRYAERITGVALEMCWYPVLESLRVAAQTRAVVEVRTVFFNFTTAEDLRTMAQYIPAGSYWLIRRFLTDWVPFDKYAKSNHPGFARESVRYPWWLTSPDPKRMRETVYEALKNTDLAKGRCIILVDSPRDSMGEMLEA